MKKTNTKRALGMSLISLLACGVMFAGSTYAWFTDEVVASGNKIESGTLKADMEVYKDGNWVSLKENPGTKIFDYDKWEPGYTASASIKILNKGNLGFRYQVFGELDGEKFGPNGESLGDVIDVYYKDGQQSPASFAEVANEEANNGGNLTGNLWAKVGTLNEWLAMPLGLTSGYMLPEGATYDTTSPEWHNYDGVVENGFGGTFVLHMREEAGNEYQGLTLGDINITLKATQWAWEKDGFGNSDYDANPVSADVWDGTADTTWYDASKDEFTLSTAEALAGLAELVDNGNTFDGKTVKLDNDLDLKVLDANGEPISFNPIGQGYNVVFKGTFDGQGHTISNLYQNGWALGLSYSTQGGGLFASVVDAEFKNLNIDNSNIVMECIDMGTLVGYSYGNCTYENITLTNSTVQNYNRYTGGLVGEVNGNQTFKNISIDETNTVSALWGTYDAAVGGIIGGKYGSATLVFENITVAARLDVFNDACSNYQYYNYRLSGMLIGMSEEVTNGVASASYLTCTNVKVIYNEWADYTYCEFESNGQGSYNGPDEWKFSRVQKGSSYDGVASPHTHDTDETHELLIVFDQLFGGDKSVKGGSSHPNVTVIYNNDKQ